MSTKFRALVLGCSLEEYYSRFDSETLKRKRNRLWMLPLFTVLVILSVFFVLDYFFSFDANNGYIFYFGTIALYPAIEIDRKKRAKAIRKILESRI